MKLRFLLILLAMICLLSSCTQSDSRISISEETTQRPQIEDGTRCIYVNTSAKKIHYEIGCRYLKRSNKENITCLPYTAETLQDLILMEFVPCNNCRFPDYLE